MSQISSPELSLITAPDSADPQAKAAGGNFPRFYIVHMLGWFFAHGRRDPLRLARHGGASFGFGFNIGSSRFFGSASAGAEDRCIFRMQSGWRFLLTMMLPPHLLVGRTSRICWPANSTWMIVPRRRC